MAASNLQLLPVEFFVFMGSITSGFAGAYLEKMYKEVKNGSKRSIWFRNVQLACFLIAVAFCTKILLDGARVT